MGKSCSPRRRPETSRSKMSSRPAWTAAARNAARTMSLPSKLIGRAGVPNPHAGDTFRQSGSPPPSLAFEQGRGGAFYRPSHPLRGVIVAGSEPALPGGTCRMAVGSSHPLRCDLCGSFHRSLPSIGYIAVSYRS